MRGVRGVPPQPALLGRRPCPRGPHPKYDFSIYGLGLAELKLKLKAEQSRFKRTSADQRKGSKDPSSTVQYSTQATLRRAVNTLTAQRGLGLGRTKVGGQAKPTPSMASHHHQRQH
jgi:hypothetical protein